MPYKNHSFPLAGSGSQRGNAKGSPRRPTDAGRMGIACGDSLGPDALDDAAYHDGYHGDATLSTWIYTITRNTCLTAIKQRTARPTVSFDESEFVDALQKLPACQTSDREAGAEMDIQVMLARLPEKYRQVITLFYLVEAYRVAHKLRAREVDGLAAKLRQGLAR